MRSLTWFLKQKDRLSALHPDMSDSMINMKILRKCGGELEHSIKFRCVEPCSTEDYIIAMEDIITRTIMGKTWIRVPMESKMVSKTSQEDKRPERPKEESDLDSSVSEDIPVEDYPIENITAFFEVTEVHTHLPQYSEDCHNLINIQDARMCKAKPARGKGCTSGASCITSILMNDIETRVNLDTGEFYACAGKDYLQAILPGWKKHLLPIEGVQFSSASNNMYPLGILDTNLVFPHPAGSNSFASDNETLGAIKGHEVDITLNIDRQYPPVLRRPAYSASPRARKALEKHIQELIQLGVLRKVRHNKEVEVTTPVIIPWHNDKSRMVGDFRALNTYTVPDRYPTPRIQETLTEFSKAKYIKSMDALKGFHQTFLTPKTRKLLRIITHCGIYEYLRMPFGIKNSPSHYQIMMNTIFPTELSEGWLIIYIDDIIKFSDSWCFHLKRLPRVLDKIRGVNMEISLKKCNFGFEELKALGHIVSGLCLGIDKNKL
ncbi:hypothetical protein O181_087357 [Austropuccinia psidii MF-1]|uniref:Reverse transcriptase domain-containing protein n=1 Tax=Austropuccinia psidii MF-1 TaxID=1389203 RepID=A0A9Q3P306_9BASI|nr:hypothetical protein [Austropuccinia psidii MF-1]